MQGLRIDNFKAGKTPCCGQGKARFHAMFVGDDSQLRAVFANFCCSEIYLSTKCYLTSRVSHFRFLFIFASKRNRNRFTSFSLRFAKLKHKFYASLRFFSLQFFRFVSLKFFTTCDLEGGNARERPENRQTREEILSLICEE